MAELKPYRGSYYLWKYVPSTPAAALFAVLFALSTGYIIWRIIKTRAHFCIVFALGGLSREKTDKLMPYVIQNIFILVAPALFAASVYMVLGRLIRSLRAESYSVVSVRWLTKIFVCGDIISFVVQGTGGGVMVTGNSMKTGERIILGGLFVQIIIFGLFVVIAAMFHARLKRQPTQASLDRSSTWRSTMVMLYMVSALIMVRSIFRVVEYIMGSDGYPLRNEWTLYVFDAVLMFGVVAAFTWRFLGGVVPRKHSNRDAEEVSMQLQDRVDGHGPLIAVVGAGPGIGEAVARRFATEGFAVALLARTEDTLKAMAADLNASSNSEIARYYITDLGSEASVKASFASIRSEMGSPEVLVYNAGARRVNGRAIIDTTSEEFETFTKTNLFGAFWSCKCVLPDMLAAGRGTILFTNATGALRGMPGLSSFSPGKFGLRSLCQIIAREYQSQGIHAVNVIVDGPVDGKLIGGVVRRKWAREGNESNLQTVDTWITQPTDLAHTYWFLHNQPRSTWTQELDVRPMREPLFTKL
ncbi:hypothetical protein N0V90_005950 [Kalmusia sp. IMI 367209]|nr:hypothetical protein N0V90_005950 [Kalmusia sp. IMI 367209]